MSQAVKTLIGTSESDTIIGSSDHEIISGKGGEDFLYGNNGHDTVWGGSGGDLIHGNSGEDILYGSGGPKVLNMSSLTMGSDYTGSVTFEFESAGYRNTLGSYKVDDDGTITDIQIHFPNASLQYSGGDLISGVSSSSLDLNAGDQVGFFIVSNGYSVNGGYTGLNFSEGSFSFVDSAGNDASIYDSDPDLYFNASDGTQTQLHTNLFHSAAGHDGVDYSLNPDNFDHTVGILNPYEGHITLGFEDLYI